MTPSRRQRVLLHHLAAAPVAMEAMEAELVGQSIEALDTPSLLVDMDALEHNIKTFADVLRPRDVVWRPHCKAIRTPQIAKLLVEHGAVGVTCAKLSQAEALLDGGIEDVLIANEVVGPTKVKNLVALAGKAKVLCVACDDEDNIAAISAAATAAGVTLSVLVDVNVGMNRCGVHYSRLDEIVRLSKMAEASPGIAYRGLMGYDGGAAETAQGSADRLHAARDAVEAAGLVVPLISGAGSEGYWVASTLGSGTKWEMQGGGGVLCCQKYFDTFAADTSADAGVVNSHKYALFVMAQVVSRSAFTAERRLIGDAGFKAGNWPFPHAAGECLPLVTSHPGLTCVGLSAEHTTFEATVEQAALPLGERILMVPYYSDSCVLLHRNLYAVRKGRVEAIWPMDGSIGRLQ